MRTFHPPALAAWLLGRRLSGDERVMVLGDLEEEFHQRATSAGGLRAAIWYWQKAARLAFGFWWWTPPAARRRGAVMTLDDVRYAVRRLRRRPMAAVVSVVTLACAIGAAAATWSLISAVLLNPLPVEHPERLVQIGYRDLSPSAPAWARGTSAGFTYPAAAAIRDATPMPLAAWGTIGAPSPLLIEAAGSERPGSVIFVSHALFGMLGVRPTVGRNISEVEDRHGAPHVAVLSERFWQLQFASDPAVVGRVIRVRNQPVTIVGVAPRGFRGLEVGRAPDLFMPLHSIDRIQPYEGLYGDHPPLHWVSLVGRLPDDVTLAQMEQQLNGLQLDLGGKRAFVLTDVQTAAISQTVRADVRQFSGLLGATVGLLLAVGSLTVGMLLLLRTDARSGELAMCLALGASRLRLAAGIVLEGLLLAAAGAVLALPVATMLFAGIRTFQLPGSIRVDRLDLSLDGRLLLGAAAAAVASVLLMAAVASLSGIRRRFGNALRSQAGATLRLQRRRSRWSLVTAQVAVTLVLVTGAGLFASSVARALSLNPGIDTSRLIDLSLDLENFGYDVPRSASFVEELRARLAQHPAIASVAFSYGARGGGVVIDGRALSLPSAGTATGSSSSVVYRAIDLRYLETLGVRVSAGRSFGPQDGPGAQPVALVSEALAQLIAPNASPLGHHIQEKSLDAVAPPAEIVGVVPGVRSVGSLSPLFFYRSLDQQPIVPPPPGRGLSVGRRLTFRASDDPDDAIGAVASTIRAMDPAIRLSPMTTYEGSVLNQMAPQRFGMTVMGALGAIALLLSALGTYVLAESAATLRQRELGIRAALGARGSQLQALLLSDTFRLVGAGLLLGFGLSWLGAGMIRAFLFQVEPFDPLVTGAAAATVVVVATLVSLRPALTVSRLDLARVLRDE